MNKDNEIEQSLSQIFNEFKTIIEGKEVLTYGNSIKAMNKCLEHYKTNNTLDLVDFKKNQKVKGDYTVNDLINLLEDVVNELDLSEIEVEKHGQLGTPPAELVRLVLAEKDRRIKALLNDFKQIC